MFKGRPDSVGDARAFTRAFVVGRDTDGLIDTVELVVSELCTNAVEHTASGKEGGLFVLQLELHPGHVHVAVIDFGAPTEPAVTDDPDEGDAMSGRGLFIVAAVSKAWGCERLRVGRRVWADVVGASS